MSKLCEIFCTLPVSCDHGSVINWQHCNTLCTLFCGRHHILTWRNATEMPLAWYIKLVTNFPHICQRPTHCLILPLYLSPTVNWAQAHKSVTYDCSLSRNNNNNACTYIPQNKQSSDALNRARKQVSPSVWQMQPQLLIKLGDLTVESSRRLHRRLWSPWHRDTPR